MSALSLDFTKQRASSRYTSLVSLGAVSTNTWYEVSLTSHITGDGIYSLRISDSQGGADYSLKEGANAPKLLIALDSATFVYACPERSRRDGGGKRVKKINPNGSKTLFPSTAPQRAAALLTLSRCSMREQAWVESRKRIKLLAAV